MGFTLALKAHRKNLVGATNLPLKPHGKNQKGHCLLPSHYMHVHQIMLPFTKHIVCDYEPHATWHSAYYGLPADGSRGDIDVQINQYNGRKG